MMGCKIHSVFWIVHGIGWEDIQMQCNVHYPIIHYHNPIKLIMMYNDVHVVLKELNIICINESTHVLIFNMYYME